MKRVFVGPLEYVPVPVARRPSQIAQADWDRMSQINNYIIDHVAYDWQRSQQAGPARERRVQPPAVTLQRGLGVCMDYAALFEAYARQYGYTARSVSSASLNHAWNQVRLTGEWWIVDTTWNAGGIATDGRPIPASVRADPDFRKQYFLTTVDQEIRRMRRGLVQHTHDVPDAAELDYQKTIEATVIIDKLDAIVTRRNKTIQEHPGRFLAFGPNAASIEADEKRIAALHAEFKAIADAYPLAVHYELHGL